MSIKVINTKETETLVKSFPKLMKNDVGDIVYFVRPDCGFPLTGEGWDYEYIKPTGWDMDYFTEYNEPLTIQND